MQTRYSTAHPILGWRTNWNRPLRHSPAELSKLMSISTSAVEWGSRNWASHTYHVAIMVHKTSYVWGICELSILLPQKSHTYENQCPRRPSLYPVCSLLQFIEATAEFSTVVS